MGCIQMMEGVRAINGEIVLAGQALAVQVTVPPANVPAEATAVLCRISAMAPIGLKGVLVQSVSAGSQISLGTVTQVPNIPNSETGIVSLDKAGGNKVYIRNWSDTACTVWLDILGYLL